MAEEFPVVFALYPRVTQLDFTGPFEVFARLPGAKCTLASASGGDLEADGGIVFAGVRRLAEVDGCALICVPGGFGTIEAMEDQESLRKTQSAMRQGQSRAARRWPGACEGDRQEASV
jgi:putative intracellular protease/amidase